MAACKDSNYTLVEIPMVEVLSRKSTHAVLHLPTHTGERSHYSCLYPCDACALRAVHITSHTPPDLLTRLQVAHGRNVTASVMGDPILWPPPVL